MKICGKCKKIKPFTEFNKDKYTKTGYRSQCKECMVFQRFEMREYYKKWRSSPEKKAWYSEYRRARYIENKKKSDARNAARKLERLPCEACGTPKAEAHHDDYSKPLNIRWLCPAHHKQWHRDNDQ